MADFRTHVTFSCAIGAGYAVIGSGMGFDLSTCVVAGGLCGVAGMLPDIDSNSGIPRREALGFAAAIVPMLLGSRFREFHLAHDQMVLLSAAVYFGIRFAGARLIGKYVVHRGMWHSIPAVLIFAGLAFLISGGSDDVFDRYLKAVAVGIGSLSHLILDEVYSIDTRGVVPKFKKSFGTAIKFFGPDPWSNFSTYAKLAAVTAVILMEPMVIQRLELRNPELAAKARAASERFQAATDRLAHRADAPPMVDAQPALQQAIAQPPVAPQPRVPQTAAPPLPYPAAAPQAASPWFAAPGRPTPGGFSPNRSAPVPGGVGFTR